jgi:CDP-glycerol glycerophosphotransferase (TagB/SpsB family)
MEKKLFAFYLDTSIHQIGYIAGLLNKMDNSVLYTDSDASLGILKKNFPEINVKYYSSFNDIINAMKSDGVKVLILQDFHYKKFNPLRDEEVKFVQIFHGTSDKTYNTNKEIVHYDLVCVSGSKMLQDMEKKGLNKNKNCIITGNLKADMVFNKVYDRDREVKNLGLDPGKKNVLYAPTWIDGMGNSSFKKFGLFLHDYFPQEYQLTIKLHPNIYLYKSDLVAKLKENIKGSKNILLLEENIKIYEIIPVLAASDALMTDVSGVSHEYIAFLRPMIFLNNKNLLRYFYGKARLRIWKAGDVVSSLEDLPKTIKNNLDNPNRYKKIQEQILHEIYDYTDGKCAQRIIEAVNALL